MEQAPQPLTLPPASATAGRINDPGGYDMVRNFSWIFPQATEPEADCAEELEQRNILKASDRACGKC